MIVSKSSKSEETMVTSSTSGTDRTDLARLLSGMDVPPARIELKEAADVQWLGRNVALNNTGHADLDAVRELLTRLGARLVM